MKRVVLAGTLLAAALIAPLAAAEPSTADVWIGFEGTDHGFLIDTDTGAAWMTGHCLKPLAKAERVGGAWRSTTREFVSVGRMRAQLDQTFEFDLSEDAPKLTVTNPARGGRQVFDAVTLRPCRGRACKALAAAPAC